MHIAAEFCGRRADRMYALAEECTDADLHPQIKLMGQQWTNRATEMQMGRMVPTLRFIL